MPDENPSEQQAEVAAPETETPVEKQVVEAPKKDEPSKEERNRAILRGEITEEAKPDPEDIDNQFDPETGELLEEDPVFEQAKAAEPVVEPAKVDDDDDDEEEKGKKEGKRTRVRTENWNARDKAILALCKDNGLSFSENEKALFPEAKPAAKEPEQAKVETAPTVADIEAQIAAVRAKRDAATEGMDFVTQNKLNDQLSDLRDQLKDTKIADAQATQSKQTQQQTSFEKAQGEASAKAESLFPDSGKKGSELNSAVWARFEKLKAERPAFFSDPDWPMTLTSVVAAELGVAPKSSKSPAPVKAAPATVIPKKVTRPVVTPVPGTQTGAVVNQTDSLRARLDAARKTGNREEMKLVMAEATKLGL